MKVAHTTELYSSFSFYNTKCIFNGINSILLNIGEAISILFSWLEVVQSLGVLARMIPRRMAYRSWMQWCKNSTHPGFH